MSLIGFLIVGIIAGFIARAVVPGDDSMGVLGTLVLGLVGSIVGGLLGSLLTGNGLELGAAGIIGSIIGAILVLLGWNAFGRGRARR